MTVSELLKMISLAAVTFTAIGTAAVFVADVLPYAKQDDFDTLTRKVAQIDIRGQQWYIESLRRQLYAARRACKNGDHEACDHARDLERQINHALQDLRDAFKNRPK